MTVSSGATGASQRAGHRAEPGDGGEGGEVGGALVCGGEEVVHHRIGSGVHEGVPAVPPAEGGTDHLPSEDRAGRRPVGHQAAEEQRGGGGEQQEREPAEVVGERPEHLGRRRSGTMFR